VEFYSGYKGDERPLRFQVNGRTLQVSEILAQWHSPEGPCFRVRADDGEEYLLRRAGPEEWDVEARDRQR
jgi:hypothetical protein